MRGPTGLGGLRYRVVPGALAAAAHHDQVAVPELVPHCMAAAARSQQQRARRADRDDRHHRVDVAPAPDPVAVPGHTVATVAVEAQAGGAKQLAELGAVMHVERRLRDVEHRIGQRRVLAVKAQQPRDVDHPLVHQPLLRLPRHGVVKALEQRVGVSDPARPQVDPGAEAQWLSLHRAAQLARAWLGERSVEQRRLEPHAHARSLAHLRTCVRAKSATGSG